MTAHSVKRLNEHTQKHSYMKFDFKNLDDQTRKLMLDEIKSDVSNGRLYLSKRFNSKGEKIYQELLTKAVTTGNEQTLASDLKGNNCFKEVEDRETKKGVIQVKIPENASETLSESEFNRYYIRALCIRALNDKQLLTVYRGKESLKPRIESEQKIGSKVDPEKLIQDLRENIGIDTALGLPPGPNSGLTVKL